MRQEQHETEIGILPVRLEIPHDTSGTSKTGADILPFSGILSIVLDMFLSSNSHTFHNIKYYSIQQVLCQKLT